MQALANFVAAGAPLVLFPPNGRFVNVVVRGSVEVHQPNITPNVNFRVTDEYRKHEPRGRVRAQLVSQSPRRFEFRFTVPIPASVASADKSGRQFYITVAATDPNGSTGKVIPVLIPNGSMGRPPGATAGRR
jgi:hypothetical protein